MINLQIRMYKQDLSYSHTASVNLDELQTEALMDVFFGGDTTLTAQGYKEVWPTNVMVRRAGKLISYKEFKKQ